MLEDGVDALVQQGGQALWTDGTWGVRVPRVLLLWEQEGVTTGARGEQGGREHWSLGGGGGSYEVLVVSVGGVLEDWLSEN